MPQVDSGIKTVLEKASIYNFFQWAVGAGKARKRFIKEFVRPQNNASLLDIGCGPGTILDYLPETIQYYGIDISPEYIEHAKKRFGNKAVFICNDVNNDDFLNNLPKMDLVIAFGVLHHLNDDEVKKLLSMIKKSMNENGRFISYDGCYVDNQSRIAKLVINNDRGQNIRTIDGYESLAKTTFQNIKTTISHNMLHIPYTHIIMECS